MLQLKDLPLATSNAASLVIPDRGWFLFGGNNHPNSWSLAEVGQDWIEGPPVYRANMVNRCAVQVRFPNLRKSLGSLCNSSRISRQAQL